MLKHEAKLIDPDAEQIVATLTEATAAANKRCRARLLADDPAKWRKFAREAAAKPEGYSMFRGGRGGVPATQVLAAWWTDAAGRKHVVLRGPRVEHAEAKRLLEKSELDTRSALWHAYPEYVCRRTVGQESQIVCACGCGAVGTPESLGWMGETCGPCFDRKQELGPSGLSANLPGALYGNRDPLRAVACTPDGHFVAAVEGNDTVKTWSLPDPTGRVIEFPYAHSPCDVAISSDGRYLVAAGLLLFAVFDLSHDPPTRHNRDLDSFALGVVALSDPTLALILNCPPDRCRADLLRVPSGETVRVTDLTPSVFPRTTYPITQLAVSPDGKTLAAIGDEITGYDMEGFAPRWTIAEPRARAAFSHDSSRLFTARAGVLKAYDAKTGRSGEQFTLARQRPESAADYFAVLAVDPTGEFVYAGSLRGNVYAFASDGLRLRAVFEWHLGMVWGLAVSADGSRLFSSGSDGCVKVWPIRDMLRGVNEPGGAA